MVDINRLVGANITGLEDKIVGYMVIFSISDNLKIPVNYMQTLLHKYGYEKMMEIPTPQKAFKRATSKLKNIKETGEIVARKQKIKVEIIYDTMQSGELEYLIRKFKIISGKKSGIVDTERLAKLYLKGNSIMVEAITRHLYSNKIVLDEKEIKKLKEYLTEKYKDELNNYDGIKIRAFVREKVLRDLCNAIPFISRGGTWFILNEKNRIQHALNLKEIVNFIREKAINGKINMLFIPLFDSEDIREKIKEDLSRELSARYKKLLNTILQRLLYAKSGEDIEKILSEMLSNEESIKSLLKEYAHIIKSTLSIELQGIEEVKDKLYEVINEKSNNLNIDSDKFQLIISAIGNYESENIKMKPERMEEKQEIKLFNPEKLKNIYEEIINKK